jgi:hypothetical protein
MAWEEFSQSNYCRHVDWFSNQLESPNQMQSANLSLNQMQIAILSPNQMQIAILFL